MTKLPNTQTIIKLVREEVKYFADIFRKEGGGPPKFVSYFFFVYQKTGDFCTFFVVVLFEENVSGETL